MEKVIVETVKSYDGTPIAWYRRGSGPPLILVPGTGAANPIAWPVFPALAQHFTVYAVDRRGHGNSGDSPAYALEREFEDIAAIVDAVGEADVLGHSFGGLCVLEAALLTHNMRKLILYEGISVTRPDEPVYPEGFLERLDAMVEAGNREGVLFAHYVKNVGMTPDDFEQFKSSPAWPERLALAHTVPRELRADERYRFDPGRFRKLHLPTLLLAGGDSPELFKAGTAVLNAALPNSRVIFMPGQEHIAMYTAPDLFLREILSFLSEAN